MWRNHREIIFNANFEFARKKFHVKFPCVWRIGGLNSERCAVVFMNRRWRGLSLRHDRVFFTTLFVHCKLARGKMACIYLGYASSRISYRRSRLPPDAISLSPLLPRGSRVRRPVPPVVLFHGFSLHRIPVLYPARRLCYSIPTTPPAFFFISIRVLRAICYDPTNLRG